MSLCQAVADLALQVQAKWNDAFDIAPSVCSLPDVRLNPNNNLKTVNLVPKNNGTLPPIFVDGDDLLNDPSEYS